MYHQENIEEFYALIGTVPGQVFRQTEHYTFIKTSNSVWPNQLINLVASKSELDAVLDEIENQVFKGLLPPILMCNPISDSPFILDKLKQRKYKSGGWMAMSHDLSLGNRLSVENILVKQVEHEAELNQFLGIIETELMGKLVLNAELFSFLQAHPDCYLYLGFDEEKPVATSILFKGSKTGGIYLVATAESHRKKGIGSLMTYTCLQKAKELNCEKVDIQATALGEPVYEKLGFESYGLIHVFRIEQHAS